MNVEKDSQIRYSNYIFSKKDFMITGDVDVGFFGKTKINFRYNTLKRSTDRIPHVGDLKKIGTVSFISFSPMEWQ